MMFSKRHKLAKEFEEWAKENGVLNCPESVIAFLDINKFLKEENGFATNKMTVYQYRPSFFEGFENGTAIAYNVYDILEIEWVKSWIKDGHICFKLEDRDETSKYLFSVFKHNKKKAQLCCCWIEDISQETIDYFELVYKIKTSMVKRLINKMTP
jgi:hypothetical protein